jgi:hypothetical protein
MTTSLLHRTLLAALTSVAVIAGSPAPAAGADTACAGLGGTVDADQTCHVHSETSSYTLDMSFPLDYLDQQALADVLTQDRDDFVDWIAKTQGVGRNRPYLHDVTAKTYRSGLPASGTQSLVLEVDDDTGAAHEGHPNTWFRALNYDLGMGAPITYDTLFKPGTDPLEVLNPIVQRELGKHPETPVHDLDANAYRNFAITDDAVIFFFGEDQVVADHNGPHHVSVPRSELASLLA